MDNIKPDISDNQTGRPTLLEEKQEVENLTPVKFNQKQKIILFVAGGIFLFLILIMFIINIKSKNVNVTNLQPSPSVVTTPITTVPQTISQFAQTDEFKSFESNLNNLKNNLDSIDLSETKLSFPSLDMNINFSK